MIILTILLVITLSSCGKIRTESTVKTEPVKIIVDVPEEFNIAYYHDFNKMYKSLIKICEESKLSKAEEEACRDRAEVAIFSLMTDFSFKQE